MKRNTPTTLLAAGLAGLVSWTAASGNPMEPASYAVFSTQAENTIFSIDDRSGSPVLETLQTDASVASAVATENQILYSAQGQWNTQIVDPSPLLGAESSVYDNSRRLTLADSEPDGIAVGNLETEGGNERIYRLRADGSDEITFWQAEVLSVSGGTALFSQPSTNQRFTYDIAADSFSGNQGSAVDVIEGAGNTGQFAANLFGQTRVVEAGYNTISTISSSDLNGAFSSKDVLYFNRDTENGAISTRDTRTGSGVGWSNFSNQIGHLVAIGGTNFVYFSYEGGAGTNWVDPDDDRDDGTLVGGYSSAWRLVSGFSFGEYALLGMESVQGDGSHVRLIDQDFNSTILFSSETSNDLAHITGAGTGYVPIPEPGSLALLSLGSLAFLRRARR